MTLEDTGIKSPHLCTRCRKPIILAWVGRQGSYCTETCYELAEVYPTSKENVVTDEKTAASPAEEKKKKAAPAKADPTADKKKAKATAPAKAAKKKTDEKNAGAGKRRNAAFPDTGVIHLLGGDNPFRAGSSRAQRFDLLKEGMTVGKWLEVIASKDLPVNLMVLEVAVENKLAKVS